MSEEKNKEQQFDKEVIKSLKRARGIFLTSNQIAKLSKMNTRTATKSLLRLKRKGLILCNIRGNRVYFKIK